MTHFLVLVSITERRLSAAFGDIDDAVAEMLAPYDEATKDERYLVFVDEEDELRARYATESTERIRCADGTLALPWDERFRKPGTFGTGSGTHEAPASLERVQVPFRETYATFEAWAKDWCGYDGPKPNGRYGHTTNPNGHWDWYQIGGRWSGCFPLIPNGIGMDPARVADVAPIWEIDKARVEATRVERRDTFLREYRALLSGKTFPVFEGPREKAKHIGLLRVERGPALAKAGEVILPWSAYVGATDERGAWNDVATVVTPETLEATYGRCFHPLVAYAAVDNDGWHAPGKMGWFGCSDDEPTAYVKWCDEFAGRFLADPSATLVLVDCHV